MAEEDQRTRPEGARGDRSWEHDGQAYAERQEQEENESDNGSTSTSSSSSSSSSSGSSSRNTGQEQDFDPDQVGADTLDQEQLERAADMGFEDDLERASRDGRGIGASREVEIREALREDSIQQLQNGSTSSPSSSSRSREEEVSIEEASPDLEDALELAEEREMGRNLQADIRSRQRRGEGFQDLPRNTQRNLEQALQSNIDEQIERVREFEDTVALDAEERQPGEIIEDLQQTRTNIEQFAEGSREFDRQRHRQRRQRRNLIDAAREDDSVDFDFQSNRLDIEPSARPDTINTIEETLDTEIRGETRSRQGEPGQPGEIGFLGTVRERQPSFDELVEERAEEIDIQEQMGPGMRGLAAAETFTSGFEDSARITGAGIDTITPFDLGSESAEDIVERRIARDLVLEEEFDEDPGEFTRQAQMRGTAIPAQIAASVPVGRAAGGAIRGAQAISPRLGQLTTGTAILGGTGLTAAEAQQARQEFEEGEEALATGRAATLTGSIAGFAAGTRQGLRDFSPEIQDTTRLDTQAVATPTGQQQAIGEGVAEGQARVTRPRMLRRTDAEDTLDIQTDFEFQTDTGTTQVAGQAELQRPFGQDTTQQFEGIGIQRGRDGDTILTEDITRGMQEGRLFREFEDTEGITRATLENEQILDETQFIDQDIQMQFDTPVEQRQFGTFTGTEDGRQIIGETEILTPQTTRGGGAGGVSAGGTTTTTGGGLTSTSTGVRAASAQDQAVQQQLDQLQRQIDSPTLAQEFSGAATGGAQARTTTQDEIQQFEANLQETQTVEDFDRDVEAVMGSPTEQLEQFREPPVTDRLVVERETENDLTLQTEQDQELQGIVEQPGTPQRPETPPGLEQVRDPDPVLLRDSPATTTPETDTLTTQDTIQQPSSIERPLQAGELDVTRGTRPDTRVEQTPQQRLEQETVPRVGLDFATPQIQRPRATTTPGLTFRTTTQPPAAPPTTRPPALPPATPTPNIGIGTGIQPETQDPVADPFGEPSQAFSPDLTAAVGLREPEIGEPPEDQQLTGLEARPVFIESEEEEEIFNNEPIL